MFNNKKQAVMGELRNKKDNYIEKTNSKVANVIIPYQ